MMDVVYLLFVVMLLFCYEMFVEVEDGDYDWLCFDE